MREAELAEGTALQAMGAGGNVGTVVGGGVAQQYP
jgi:hypothetical protein